MRSEEDGKVNEEEMREKMRLMWREAVRVFAAKKNVKSFI